MVFTAVGPTVKPITCSGCILNDPALSPDVFIAPFGTGSNGVQLVGMAPAKNEIERGEPFVGRAGAVLGKVLRKIGYKNEFDIRNVLQCRPPSDQWTGKEEWAVPAIAHCKVHRESGVRPKVRVALGEIAFRTLTGLIVPISKARGYRFEPSARNAV